MRVGVRHRSAFGEPSGFRVEKETQLIGQLSEGCEHLHIVREGNVGTQQRVNGQGQNIHKRSNAGSNSPQTGRKMNSFSTSHLVVKARFSLSPCS